MSQEQAKGFFEAISEDKQLAEEVKDVLDGQATKQEKAKELLSLAKAHNFNFTEDELKTSLSIDDLADVSGGMFSWSSLSRLGLSILNLFGIGGTGGQQPLPAANGNAQNQPVAPIVIVQPAAIDNAQNQDRQQEAGENEVPPEADDEETETNEIRELTPEEIAVRQQREEQERRGREERLAQGPLEMEAVEPNWFEDDGTNRLFREIDDTELLNRINRLNTLYYRLLYAPQGQELMDRIRNYIATANNTLPAGTASLQEQISIADALIHEAEEMLQSAEQQRGEEIREEIQQGLDALALILQRTHTGLPGGTDLYTDVQTFLANRDSYSREERIRRARWLLSQAKVFHSTLNWNDPLHLDNVHMLFNLNVWSWGDDEQAVLEERLENNALPWLASIHMQSCAPGEPELALEIQEFLTTIDGDFTDEHLEGMNSLLDRARDMMLNRAREHSRFDTDQEHIRNNDLQLAQMLGIDKEYIQEKIKNKIKMSPDDIPGIIELPDGDTVTFNFMIGSGTLVLTGSGNTVIGNRSDNDSLWRQLKKAGIVFVIAGPGWISDQTLPTPDHPFVVRNLIIGNGIAGVGEDAFFPARTFRSVYFMGPIQFIGENAFSSCDHLVEIGFAQPEKLERLDKGAFGFNNVLTSINIPQNANIAENAFEFCRKLEKQGCPYCKSSK